MAQTHFTSVPGPPMPLAFAPIHAAGNKLSNLQKLSSLSERLDFSVPEAQVLTAAHFSSAVDSLFPGPSKHMLVETLSSVDASRLRQSLLVQPLPDVTQQALATVHQTFRDKYADASLCVRSCFGLEDLVTCSFAGAFDTVHSVDSFEMLCRAVQVVYASVFSDRAINEIRNAQLDEFPEMSVAIQLMIGGAGWSGGVTHTQCPDLSPFPLMQFSVANSAATVTSGSSIPEEFLVQRLNVHQPNLQVIVQSQPGSQTEEKFRFSDSCLKRLAATLLAVEEAFETPLEIEWLVDPAGSLHLLQARPVFLSSASAPTSAGTDALDPPLVTGMPVGNGRVTATVRRVHSLAEAQHVPPGFIIATDNTDPDWVPVVRRAAGLVAAIGARTSHVSRTARESAVLAVVGCGSTIDELVSGTTVTLVCAEGIHGAVYAGDLPEDALVLSTEDAHINNVAAAFSLARNSEPRHVFFDLSDVLQAYRLPSLADGIPLSPRITRRIAGHSDVASFALEKLVQAVCLVSTAFPLAQLHLRLDTKSPWRRALPGVIDTCREQYGVFSDLDWCDQGP